MLQKLGQRLKNQKGLTLIELLAVIVILGIIAAIAIPSIGGIINKSEKDAQVAEGIQIISAAKIYTTSNNPEDGDTLTHDGENATAALQDYLDNVKDNGYTVTINKNETTGQFTYSLSGHASVGLVKKDDTSVTEEELLAY